MATILVSDTNLTNIANAIREKNGETTSYKVNEMANAIENISVSSGATEDLSSELSTQNSLITTQETTIDSIISALEGKASGGSGGGLQKESLTVNVNTSSIKSDYPLNIYYTYYFNIDGYEETFTSFKKITSNTNTTLDFVMKGSQLYIVSSSPESGLLTTTTSSGSEVIGSGSGIVMIPINANETISVTGFSSGGGWG